MKKRSSKDTISLCRFLHALNKGAALGLALTQQVAMCHDLGAIDFDNRRHILGSYSV